MNQPLFSEAETTGWIKHPGSICLLQWIQFNVNMQRDQT